MLGPFIKRWQQWCPPLATFRCPPHPPCRPSCRAPRPGALPGHAAAAARRRRRRGAARRLPGAPSLSSAQTLLSVFVCKPVFVCACETAAGRPNECNANSYRARAGHYLEAHFDDRQLSGDTLVNLSLGARPAPPPY